MLDTICTLPIPSDVFTQALHPTQPFLTVGLSSGHVQTYRLPADSDDSDSDSAPPSSGQNNGTTAPPIISHLRRSSSASENGLGSIDTIWKTRRHKGSCRCLTFSPDGEVCYSAGTDGLVKVFLSENGKVVSKVAIPSLAQGEVDPPTLLHALSPQGLLLGTDSGKLYLHDLRQGGGEVAGKAAQTWTPHGEEHINALIPLPVSETSTSGFPKQWVSVGGTTLSVTDVRKGTIATSEDQEMELTSVAMVEGLKKGGTSVGQKVIVGQADGVLSLWEKGVWGDLDERILVDRMQAGIESLCEVPMDLAWKMGKLKMNEKVLAVGLEDGRVRFVRIGRNGVLGDWDVKHDEVDGAVGLNFDQEGRMVSGGGQAVKVWTEAVGGPGASRSAKRDVGDEDDEDSSAEYASADSSDEESTERGERKKRKRNKGKDKSGGAAIQFSL